MKDTKAIVAIAVAAAVLGAFAKGAKTDAPGEMETRIFSIVRPGAGDSRGEDPSREWREGDWKSYLWLSMGVSWPKGSSIRILDSGELEITNNPEELDVLADRLAPSRIEEPPASSLFVRTHFVVAPREALDACGWDAATPPEDAAKLLKSLLARGDVRLAAELSALTDPGEQMFVKSVREYIYPTDFHVHVSPSPLHGETNATRRAAGPGVGFAVCEPQYFTMRETGFILDVTPSVGDDGKIVSMEMDAQYVGEPTWRDFGMSVPAAGEKRSGYSLPMEQPFFPVASFLVRYQTVFGRTHVFTTPMPGGDTSRTLLLFVRIDLLD